MLIYIHVPFCRSRCKYCAFHSVALGRNQMPESSLAVQSYVDALLLELALWADRLGSKYVPTIFFGGGTPSLLPAKIIGIVLDRIHKYFKVDPHAEITLEANPESLKGSLQPTEYLKAGINRLSIGLQSLDGDMLHLLGRPHKAQEGMNALWAAKDAGFVNVSVDLMWGLPGQSVYQWLQSLKDIVNLAPMHISAYGLTLEKGTPLERDCVEGKITLPPERDQNIMFMDGAAFLQSQGYLHYEISNFAKMGYQCRHNMGYWQGEDYLGLGPSSTSTINDKRWTNPANQQAWEDRVRAGKLGGEEEELTPLIKVLEMMMLSLRTSRGLELKKYQLMTGHNFIADHQQMVQSLHENGLVRVMQGYMRLTTSGMLVSNAILSNLFERTKKVLENPLPYKVKSEKSKVESDSLEIREVVWPRI
ncbi:MAG: radical SAM family heme chaperone HemW [Desulfovibrionaceae bacterium]|nr:radical SAM family heme chaperone HemW [Desulfovibrionaceae bacterium]